MGRDLGRGRKPPTGTMCFEPGVGGRLLEVYDEGEPFQVGRVLVWEPHDRLVFEYRQGNFDPDQITEVEVRFEPAGVGESEAVKIVEAINQAGFENLKRMFGA